MNSIVQSSIVCLIIAFAAVGLTQCATISNNLTPQDSCRPGWVNVMNQCYFISNFTLEWQDARAWCNNEHSRLFVIDSQEQFDAVMEYIPKLPMHFYWVGLNDLEKMYDFVWEDGRRTNTSDPLFKPNQFVNHNPVHDGCVNIDIMAGYLDDWECYDPSYFVCQY